MESSGRLKRVRREQFTGSSVGGVQLDAGIIMQGPKKSLNATSVNLGVLHYWRQNNITIGTVTAQNETEYA